MGAQNSADGKRQTIKDNPGQWKNLRSCGKYMKGLKWFGRERNYNGTIWVHGSSRSVAEENIWGAGGVLATLPSRLEKIKAQTVI